MITYIEADLALKKLNQEEFFNSKFMSVAVVNNKETCEIVVYLHKKINTSNLPREYEGLRVSYQLI